MTQYILDATHFQKSRFIFGLFLAWGWIIKLLCQLCPTATFNNCLNDFIRKRGGLHPWLENNIALVREKHCLLVSLVTIHYTIHGMAAFVSQRSNCSACISRNIKTACESFEYLLLFILIIFWSYVRIAC